MVSAKRLSQMAKKWQTIAAIGRKRLTRTTTAAKGAGNDECCATSPSVAMKGHCVVYTADRARFEVPLAYLGTSIFSELLRMSQEEFRGDDGRIMLPCDAAVMEYAMCLLQRDASMEVMKAFMSSVARPRSFEGSVVGIGLNQQLAVC
ncbi:LOW QUALITY PROTEIN: hypothetical protein CFC21_067209 [Triticum aestivum]|uniref:Auxin-responsive protein SAUR36 n=2 Tax=Triticum aestivum TaxID=4565 RepID=A0A9R1KNI7_WHEAT|nr:LOW QUALITY PROTEIN: hypothetical protein CFC21_067209 [Triticum aestivum]